MGYPSAERFLADIDSDEWTECLAFYELDPFGEQRADLRFARAMALFASAHGASHAKPKDFILFDPHAAPPERPVIARVSIRERLRGKA